MSHVLVRLSGYRLRLVPYWPYRFAEVAGDATAVEVTRWTSGGPVATIVDPAGAEHDPSVVDVLIGPDDGE